MGIKQTQRLIQIATPLEEDTFVVLSFSGTEEISGLFGFELELASTRNDIGFAELAGQNATVGIRSGNGDMRFINGVIVEFTPTRISEEKDYCLYYAVMLPALWSLKQCYDWRLTIVLPKIKIETVQQDLTPSPILFSSHRFVQSCDIEIISKAFPDNASEFQSDSMRKTFAKSDRHPLITGISMPLRSYPNKSV